MLQSVLKSGCLKVVVHASNSTLAIQTQTKFGRRPDESGLVPEMCLDNFLRGVGVFYEDSANHD